MSSGGIGQAYLILNAQNKNRGIIDILPVQSRNESHALPIISTIK